MPGTDCFGIVCQVPKPGRGFGPIESRKQQKLQKRSCSMSRLVVPGESEKTSGLRAGALLPGEAVQTFDFCLAVTVSCIQMSHCCRK